MICYKKGDRVVYESKNNSKFLLRYHIIFVCKYRKQLLIKLGDEMKNIMYGIAERYDFKILEMEVDKDHIHFMVETEPKISPMMIIRVLKQQSTINIWKTNKDFLRRYYWYKNIFWTDGYFVSTIGEVSSGILRKYIENQG